MASALYGNFQERVEQAAESALKRHGSVGPLELFQAMLLLQPVHFEGWRLGRVKNLDSHSCSAAEPVLRRWLPSICAGSAT